MHDLKQFAASSNGDRWFLATSDETQERFVLHRANQPSGGHETRTSIRDFLNIEPQGPERAALIEVLGVEDDQSDASQDSYTSSSL
jgi:hypothetical protein